VESDVQTLPQLRAHVIGIEVGDSEIEVIDGGSVPSGLLNAKKGISDTENSTVADCCLSGIPKNS
jgi:hypothetical protein